MAVPPGMGWDGGWARLSGCCPESPISCPYEGLGKKGTGKNGCPTRDAMGRGLGTIVRLLPGISDIVPLKRLGKKRTAKNGCPTQHAMGRRLGTIFRCCPESPILCPYEGLGKKADSQEWLSYLAWDGAAVGHDFPAAARNLRYRAPRKDWGKKQTAKNGCPTWHDRSRMQFFYPTCSFFMSTAKFRRVWYSIRWR